MHRIGGTAVHQVVNDRLADLVRQRKTFLPAALAADGHLTVTPVDVLQAQRGDLPGSQSEPCQQHDHRVLASPQPRGPVTGFQECLGLGWADSLRQQGGLGRADQQRRAGQIALDLSGHQAEPQERPKGVAQLLHRHRRPDSTFFQQCLSHLRRRQLDEATRRGLAVQESAHARDVRRGRTCLQTTLAQQVLLEPG